ncbi:hypothetical protein IGB42_03212 [Andreprevotia sp. IGB-42]|uniref:hypothetical protein n=1 Tax=Andreprevotia sp. IGB-42 TaxID=2497473 RepID=UPI0013576A56|nr:hypothetical protein [Andreprevotia sp. IGB-42]KAF0812222.1 hypothetical protein IGB42_03212 [Andreprevotia sp. IGB-42]
MMDLKFRAWLDNLLGQPARHVVPDTLRMRQSSHENPQQVFADVAAQLRMLPGRLHELAESRSGYEREGVLCFLADKMDTRSLAIVIARLNDWVPQVRARAEQIYRSYLLAGRVDDLLACIDGLYGLQQKQRVDHAALLQDTYTLLLHPQHLPGVRQALQRGRGGAARFLLGLLLQHTDIAQAAREGMRHSDPAVRQQALTAGVQLPPPVGWAILMAGLTDRAPAVRSQAIRLVMGTPLTDNDKLQLCQRMLLDISLGPREIACWHAARLGLDVRRFYQEAIGRAGLSERELMVLMWEAVHYKLAEGFALAEKHLGHRRALVRLAAIRALLVLAPERRSEVLERVWLDPSRKLKRYVLALIGDGLALQSDALYHAAHAAWLRDDNWLALALSKRLSDWQHLELQLALLDEPRLQASVLAQLAPLNQPYNWLAYARPYGDDQQRIAALLQRAAVRQQLNTLPHLVAGLAKAGLWTE